MEGFDAIAEARIRAWLQRPPAEREATALPPDPLDTERAAPLEVLLMKDIRALDALAARTVDAADVAALRERASELTLRLMVVLETTGRPLAARYFAEQRAQWRSEDGHS